MSKSKDKQFNTIDKETSHKDEKIEALERDNQYLKDRIQEERFCWCLVVFILFDVFFFTFIQGLAGQIVIGLLQVLLLIIIGRNLGIDEPRIFLMKYLDGKK